MKRLFILPAAIATTFAIGGCSLLATKAASSLLGQSDKPMLDVSAHVGDNGLKSTTANSGNNSGTINGGDTSAKIAGNDFKNHGKFDDQVNGTNIDTSGAHSVQINTIKDSHLLFLMFIMMLMTVGWFLDSPALLFKRFMAWRKGMRMKIVWVKNDDVH